LAVFVTAKPLAIHCFNTLISFTSVSHVSLYVVLGGGAWEHCLDSTGTSL